jgi:hypothetical protein
MLDEAAAGTLLLLCSEARFLEAQPPLLLFVSTTGAAAFEYIGSPGAACMDSMQGGGATTLEQRATPVCELGSERFLFTCFFTQQLSPDAGGVGGTGEYCCTKDLSIPAIPIAEALCAASGPIQG